MPLRFYAGYDRDGTPALGRGRWSAGANWGDAFGLDQQLSYQFTTGDDFWSDPGSAAFTAHSLTYVVPLPWRDKINIFGSYARAVPRLGPDLGLVGISGQASLRYVKALPDLRIGGLLAGLESISQDLQVGYDFKTSNNDLSFGGETVSDVTTEVDQFSLLYSASTITDYGQYSLSNMLVWSPGNLSSGNNDLVFQQQASSPFAKARYVYNTLTATQSTRLPFNAAWVTRFVAQISDTNLIPSEQLGAGGADSVRGYDERAASGSVGFFMSQELRTPPVSLLSGRWSMTAADQAQFLMFWDYGVVRDAQYNPDSPAGTKLSSIGVGLRYTVGHVVDFRFDYGWQQRRLPGADRLNGLAHIAVTASY
jgi:hemolysin activation/secretion protein